MLLQMQQEEIDQLLEMKAQGHDVEKQMQAAHNQHILEQEQLAANQKKQIWDVFISGMGGMLSDLTSLFLEFYKASGEKHKELFTLFKAASIAQALIATYESAVKAYNSMVDIPYVGPVLAKAAAGVAIAMGMAKVQLIRQQQMAAGGEVGMAAAVKIAPYTQAPKSHRAHVGKVPGVSPHPKADNVLVHATAGEFMHPVDVVKYYGIRGMEIIRKKLIPREVLEYYAQRKQTRRLVDNEAIFIKHRTRKTMTDILIEKSTHAIRRAAGGMIPGVSPHPRADNIDVRATAGEFMQPVPVVKYYTRQGMEAIRRMLVPPEIIQAFAAPGVNIPRAAHLASGGTPSAAGSPSGPTLSSTVNITMPEQLDFIGRRLEAEIEPVVLRVLQEELKY